MPDIAEGKIVHGALGYRQNTHGPIEVINHRLAGFDIPGHRRRRGPRVQERARWNDKIDRGKATFVQGNGIVHQSAEHERAAARVMARGAFVLPADCGVGAGEVYHCPPRHPIDAQCHPDRGTIVHFHGEATISCRRSITRRTAPAALARTCPM